MTNVTAMIREARELAACAAPGPWRHEGNLVLDAAGWTVARNVGEDDGLLIARGRTLIDELVDALERLAPKEASDAA